MLTMRRMRHKCPGPGWGAYDTPPGTLVVSRWESLCGGTVSYKAPQYRYLFFYKLNTGLTVDSTDGKKT